MTGSNTANKQTPEERSGEEGRTSGGEDGHGSGELDGWVEGLRLSSWRLIREVRWSAMMVLTSSTYPLGEWLSGPSAL